MMLLIMCSSAYQSNAVLNIDGTQSSNYLFSMTSAEKLAAKTGITVHAGETFYIDDDVDMNTGSQILVNQFGLGGNGAQLFIMSRLYCSQGTWKGVKVLGVTGQNHHIVPPDNTTFNDHLAYRGVLNPVHGYLELWTGCKIEKAEHGAWSLNGGIIQSWIVPSQNTAKFIDCREGIYIENCQQNPSAIRINRCELTWTDPNIWGQSDYTIYFKHIMINNSRDAYFGGCILSGQNSNFYSAGEKGVGFAMFGESSATFGEAGDAFFSDPLYCTPIVRYRMQPNTPEPGNISHLSLGLVAEGYELGVNHTTFSNNMIGIGEMPGFYTIGIQFVDLHDNIFYNSDWMLSQQFDLSPAQKILVSIIAQEATIYDNSFTEDQGILTGGTYVYPYTSVGLLNISTTSAPQDYKVYRNSFNGSEASHGSSAVQSPVGLSVGSFGSVAGLEWKCNTFKNLEKGVSYTGSAGPTDNPINLSKAGNTYINCSVLDIENNTGTFLEYYTGLPSLNIIGGRRRTGSGQEISCTFSCTVRTKNKTDYTSQTATLNELTEDTRFSFYPNPAQDKLTFVFDAQSGPAALKIYSMQGQEVMQLDVVSGQAYDVSQLTKGFYTISITINGVKQYKTLVISK